MGILQNSLSNKNLMTPVDYSKTNPTSRRAFHKYLTVYSHTIISNMKM